MTKKINVCIILFFWCKSLDGCKNLGNFGHKFDDFKNKNCTYINGTILEGKSESENHINNVYV